jgi:hypothetical protein
LFCGRIQDDRELWGEWWKEEAAIRPKSLKNAEFLFRIAASSFPPTFKKPVILSLYSIFFAHLVL